MMKVKVHGLLMRTFTVALSGLISSPCLAEITLDGTLGPSGSLTGPDFAIPATVGEQVGPNLFHSFGEFNINTGESATFTGPAGLDNVIGRVTGGESSSINGALNSTIPGADLYLINPAGVMFGPDAQLNVPGSFHVSTADYMRVGKGGVFSATNPQASTLTVAPPSAFGFLDRKPAPISVEAGTLESPFAVPAGEALSLIGGNIAIRNGVLLAPSGRINIASVASPGEVRVADGGLNVDSFERLGDIVISQATAIGTSGDTGGTVVIRGGDLILNSDAVIEAATTGNGTGGAVNIQLSGDLVVNDSIIGTATISQGTAGTVTINTGNLALQNGSLISSGSLNSSSGNGGSITITASGGIRVSGTDSRENSSRILASTTGSGKGGNLLLMADELIIDDGSIASNSDSSGAAGNVTVIVRGALTMDGGFLQSDTLGGADAGNVVIRANDLTLNNGAQITSGIGSILSDGTVDGFLDGKGAGGTLSVTVTDTFSISEGGLFTSAEIGLGDAGNLSVSTGNLNISDGGVISASTASAGDGGDIIVTATGDILINSSFDALGNEVSGINTGTSGSGAAGSMTIITGGTLTMGNGLLYASTSGNGNAGAVTVEARDVYLTNGAQVSSATIGDGSQTNPGEGGDIKIKVSDTLSISGTNAAGFESALTSLSRSQGDAGNIYVSTGSLIINDSGGIGSLSGGSGEAGDIAIRVIDTAQLNDGSITAEAANTSGGNIRVNAGSLQLTGDSEVTSSVFGDLDTSGGNVTIDGGSLVSFDDSQVTAFATQGLGGNITINSNVFLADRKPVSRVLNASSDTLGNDGTVEVNSPDNDIAGRITKLPASFLNAAALLSRRCAARDADETSSFVIVGRGGVPRGPDDWALSSYGDADTKSDGRDADVGIDERDASYIASAPGKLPVTMLKVSCAR